VTGKEVRARAYVHVEQSPTFRGVDAEVWGLDPSENISKRSEYV